MRKFVFFSILLVFIIGPFAFLFAAMETTPLVKSNKTATSADAKRARALLTELRARPKPGKDKRVLKVTEADINAIVAFSARAVPTLRGRATVDSDAVHIASSVKVPGGRWLNGRVAVAASKHGLNVRSVSLGRFELPSIVVVPLVRFGLNIVFGDNVGTILATSIDGVAIDGKTVSVGIRLTDADRETVTTRVKSRIRNVADVDVAQVRTFYASLDSAAKAGRAGVGSSTSGYLRLMMKLVHENASESNRASIRQSALLALAIYCGHPRVESFIGEVVPAKQRGKRTRCAATTLGGRRDLRQHFIISAGLQAASNGAIAFTIGEFKELLDSSDGGSGFSFDDLAADRAGIRLANLLLGTEVSRWPELVARLTEEKDIFPSIAGLPAGLSEKEFERRYGDVNTEAYKQVLADIERRIDALAFFTGS